MDMDMDMGEGRTGLDDVEATERFLLLDDAETALSCDPFQSPLPGATVEAQRP